MWGRDVGGVVSGEFCPRALPSSASCSPAFFSAAAAWLACACCCTAAGGPPGMPPPIPPIIPPIPPAPPIPPSIACSDAMSIPPPPSPPPPSEAMSFFIISGSGAAFSPPSSGPASSSIWGSASSISGSLSAILSKWANCAEVDALCEPTGDSVRACHGVLGNSWCAATCAPCFFAWNRSVSAEDVFTTDVALLQD